MILSARFKQRGVVTILLAGLVIYAMVVPLLILDVCASVYQAVVFALLKIEKVSRSNYIAFDRSVPHIGLLDRLHCHYCGYANGLLAWAREIALRTEQYWCPLKHVARELEKSMNHPSYADPADPSALTKKLQTRHS